MQTGQLCTTLYRAHGNAVDYMYKKAGIKYAYAVHLRDTGTVRSLLSSSPDPPFPSPSALFEERLQLMHGGIQYGFSLPAAMIRPAGEETGEMVEYMARFIKAKLQGGK